MGNKYNPKLFLIGFFSNLLKKMPLLLIAVILAIIGIKNQTCGHIALGVVLLALIWSLIQQIRIKYAVEHSDNPNFEPFAKAMMSDNWKEEFRKIVEEKHEELEESEENNIEE